MQSNTGKINTKQLAFIEEYMVNGFNATQAYMKVYKESSYASARGDASRLLSKANIKAEVEARMEEFKAKYNITKEYLVNELLLLINNAKNEPAFLNPNNQTDRREWNKALQTLAKITGNDIIKQEINHSGEIRLQFGNGFIPGLNDENDIKEDE